MTPRRRRRCRWVDGCDEWATYIVTLADLPLCTPHARTYWARRVRAALHHRPRPLR